MKILNFALQLRRMTALPRILLLIHRLGGTVTYVSAAEGRANIVVHAPAGAAHRFASQVRKLFDVLELTELRMARPHSGEHADERNDDVRAAARAV